MRISVIMAFALFCVAAPASAQQPAPSPAPAAEAPAAPADPAAPAVRKADRCREQGRQQKLRGEALRDFVQVCHLETRLTCLKDAIAKKVIGPARRDYLKSCEA